jgi:plasmid stabilization system protein ParE
MSASKPYRIHPEAWLEIEAADNWYVERSVDASANFIAAISEGFENISQAPRRWPRHLHGTRRLVLQRFPFSIIYFDDPAVVNVVAVAHGKRKPGYWKARV